MPATAAANIPELFPEFVAAATAAPVAQTRDVLDDMGEWLAFSAARIAAIRQDLARLIAEGKRRFGECYSEYEFSRCCEPDDMAKACWAKAVRRVEADFIAPQHIDVPNTGSFLVEALGFSDEPRDEKIDDLLKSWDAGKIRTHFRRTFGDVREAAIAQLRAKAIDAFGRKRPEEVSTLWCHVHEHSHRGGFMQLTYQSRHIDRFGDIVRYLIHLTKGESPAEIKLPAIFGYNDGTREWDRKELLKRQKAPFPGCEWMRFAADGYLQMKIEAAPLALLQSQYDAVRPVGGE